VEESLFDVSLFQECVCVCLSITFQCGFAVGSEVTFSLVCSFFFSSKLNLRGNNEYRNISVV